MVARSVGDGRAGVIDSVSGVRNLVAGCVQRLVGVGSRGIDVIFRVILDRSLVRGIVVGVLLARGKAEREDRNGHSNFLHDRSTPFLSARGWGAGLGLLERVAQARPGAIAAIPTILQGII